MEFGNFNGTLVNGTIELNSAIQSSQHSYGKITQDAAIVKIYSHLASGKPMSEINSVVDKAGITLSPEKINDGVRYIKSLAKQANGGNPYAISELNEIRTFAVWPLLQEEMKLLGFMGSYQNVGYNDSVFATVKKIAPETRFQALNGDVPFGATEYNKYPVTFETISGGWALDYRKIAFGNLEDDNLGMEQTRVQLRNKAQLYVLWNTWNTINTTNNVKFVSQGSGVTKTAVDDMITNLRRFGRVNIFGDFAIAQKLNPFVAFEGVVPVAGGVSQAALNEIRRTGLLGLYNSAVVQAIENPFNLTRPLPSEDGFETYFPQNILFFVPSGTQSPVRNYTRGGLTSCQGLDVQSGKQIVRMDLEIGSIVNPTEEYKIGIITDTSMGDTPIDPRLQ